MNNLIIYTNNGVALDFLEQKQILVEYKWFSSPSIEVLQSAKTIIRQGGVLLSNPMEAPRSASPFSVGGSFSRRQQQQAKVDYINPYVSLLIDLSSKMLDFRSAKTIDDAIALYKKNVKQRFRSHNDEATKNFQIHDLESLAFALHSALSPEPGPWHG